MHLLVFAGARVAAHEWGKHQKKVNRRRDACAFVFTSVSWRSNSLARVSTLAPDAVAEAPLRKLNTAKGIRSSTRLTGASIHPAAVRLSTTPKRHKSRSCLRFPATYKGVQRTRQNTVNGVDKLPICRLVCHDTGQGRGATLIAEVFSATLTSIEGRGGKERCHSRGTPSCF